MLKFDGELYELLKNPVADETFKLMYQVKDCGFLQFRGHFRPLLRNKENGRSVDDKKAQSHLSTFLTNSSNCYDHDHQKV